jgi:glycosyltransferase involved in cell wall biosynthesis
MKILIFSTAYFPFVGGAELATKEITDRISDFEFDMVTLKLDKKSFGQEKIGNINVHRISSSKLFFPFRAYLAARRLHKKRKYNIIWSIMANRAGFAALFFKLNYPKVKFLLTLQEGDPFDYPKKRAGILWLFVGFLFKRIFIKADYIQVISKYLAGWAKNMGAKCPIDIIPNGVNINRFKNYDLTSKNNKEIVLITTSRLVPKNGIKDLIDAVKILVDEGYKIKLLIFGKGPEEINLKSQISNLKINEEVLLLGHVPYEEIPKYLKISDIFIRPSLSEGMGSSFVEAMAAGLPVVATQVGGIIDFLFDSERNPDKKPTGWAVDPHDPRGIAGAVKKILNNSGQTAQIVANAKKLAFEKYDWYIIASDMKKIFERL